MKIPSIGELRARLILQEKVETINTRGGKDISWHEHSKMWGKIIPTSGMPHMYTDNLENKITDKIIIRNNDAVTRTMRIENGEMYWTINTIIHHTVSNKRFMELLCTQQDSEV